MRERRGKGLRRLETIGGSIFFIVCEFVLNTVGLQNSAVRPFVS
jgi:hypothetical protein